MAVYVFSNKGNDVEETKIGVKAPLQFLVCATNSLPVKIW